MGLRIVVVGCDEHGNVDTEDLERKIAEHKSRIAALMITYPSTHGVFEEAIVRICEQVHAARPGLHGRREHERAGRPGEAGADRRRCLPHQPAQDLLHPAWRRRARHGADRGRRAPEGFPPDRTGPVSAAPYGSALILPISWMYIRMMGAPGIRAATEVAILNANYIAARLARYFPVLYTGARGRVAHECILDLRKLKETCGVTAEDVAKRLMDYGFHAPTLSFPVADTLMVEPTESESKDELDRFCDAMIAIHGELERIRAGRWDRADNLLKNARTPRSSSPATGSTATAARMLRTRSRGCAARSTGRRSSASTTSPATATFVCTCPPIEAYAE